MFELQMIRLYFVAVFSLTVLARPSEMEVKNQFTSKQSDSQLKTPVISTSGKMDVQIHPEAGSDRRYVPTGIVKNSEIKDDSENVGKKPLHNLNSTKKPELPEGGPVPASGQLPRQRRFLFPFGGSHLGGYPYYGRPYGRSAYLGGFYPYYFGAFGYPYYGYGDYYGGYGDYGDFYGDYYGGYGDYYGGYGDYGGFGDFGGGFDFD